MNFLLSDEDTLILQYKEKYYIITAKNIKKGKIDILAGCTYIILDEVSGQNFNFVIPEGDVVTIKILEDMEIDNRGYIEVSNGTFIVDNNMN